MHLYPASLLITAAVLLPNLLFLVFPPLNVSKYGKSADSLLFTIVERVGQVGSFFLPLFFPLSFSGRLVTIAWTVMGLALAFYYAGWLRFFLRGRDYALLFRPMLGIPVPIGGQPNTLLSTFVGRSRFRLPSGCRGGPWDRAHRDHGERVPSAQRRVFVRQVKSFILPFAACHRPLDIALTSLNLG